MDEGAAPHAADRFRGWLRAWVATLKYGSVFTRAGRDLRRRASEPFDLDDYIEVEFPT